MCRNIRCICLRAACSAPIIPFASGQPNPKWQTATGTFKLIEEKDQSYLASDQIYCGEFRYQRRTGSAGQGKSARRPLDGLEQARFRLSQHHCAAEYRDILITRLRSPVSRIRPRHVQPRKSWHDHLLGVRAGEIGQKQRQGVPERISRHLPSGNHHPAACSEDTEAVRPAGFRRTNSPAPYRPQSNGHPAGHQRRQNRTGYYRCLERSHENCLRRRRGYSRRREFARAGVSSGGRRSPLHRAGRGRVPYRRGWQPLSGLHRVVGAAGIGTRAPADYGSHSGATCEEEPHSERRPRWKCSLRR